MPAPRAVLDTNTLVSALLGKGATGRLYGAFKQKKFLLISSRELIAELAEVLSRPDFQIPASDIKTAFRLLRQRALIVRSTTPVKACRDPKDDPVLECAISGRADWIVTGDKDLLALHPFRAIRIVTPANFLLHLFRSP